MRFTLEATASEFPEKGPALIKRLAKALDPVSPQLADSIRKILPESEHELRYPVLQALKDKATAIYRDQLKLMVEEILEVLRETPEELQLHKAGPYVGPKGGLWADPQHTEHWVPAVQQTGMPQMESSAEMLQRYAQKFSTKTKENIKVGLAFFAEMGIPARMLSANDPQWIRDGIKRKGAAFHWDNPDTGKSEIVVNPYANYWKDPKVHSQQHGDKGDKYFSSDHPMRSLIHELGHFIYQDEESSESAFINDHHFREKVEAEVGKYAASNVHDFIAEVYTGLITGRSYSPEIMDRYNTYKKERQQLGKSQSGPYIGPKGGKWANPQHTIHWDPEDPAHTGKSLWDVIEAAGVKVKPHYTDFNKLVLKAPKEMAGKLEQLREAGHLPDAVIMSEYYAILPISKNFYEHIAKKTAPSMPGTPPKKEELLPQVKEAIAAPSEPVEAKSSPAYGKHAWAPHKSVAEAKEWAKQFGIDTAYKDLDTANAVNKALSGQHPWVLAHIHFVGSTQDLHEWAKDHPDIVHVAKHASAHPADLTKFALKGSTVAEAHPIGMKPYTQSVVAINDEWSTEKKYQAHGKEKSGFSRCTTLVDTLRHECGHVEAFVLRHVRPFGPKGPSAWDIWKKHCAHELKTNVHQVEKEISEYSTINPHECWAEIAVMRRKGIKLPEWVESAIAEMRIDYKPWDQIAPAVAWGK